MSACEAQCNYVAADLDVMTKSCVDCLLHQLRRPSCCGHKGGPIIGWTSYDKQALAVLCSTARYAKQGCKALYQYSAAAP